MMSAKKTDKNHIIPKHYLKGFCIAKTKKVWLNYKTPHPNPNLPYCHKKSISKVAYERGFYSQSTEDILAKTIENDTAPIIQKIRNDRIFPTADERSMLARYIINLISRVRAGKSRVYSFLPQVYETEFDKNKVEKDLGRKLSIKETLELDEIRNKWENNPEKGKELWEHILKSNRASQAINKLQSMTWQFLVVPTSSYIFLTCDNPVFFFRDIGIGNRDISELSFPISSEVTLWASHNSKLEENFIIVEPSVVEEINSRTVANATNEIYSSTTGGWIKRFTMRKSVLPRRIVTRYGKHHTIPK